VLVPLPPALVPLPLAAIAVPPLPAWFELPPVLAPPLFVVAPVPAAPTLVAPPPAAATLPPEAPLLADRPPLLVEPPIVDVAPPVLAGCPLGLGPFPQPTPNSIEERMTAVGARMAGASFPREFAGVHVLQANARQPEVSEFEFFRAVARLAFDYG
jgi:hypothetical protein